MELPRFCRAISRNFLLVMRDKLEAALNDRRSTIASLGLYNRMLCVYVGVMPESLPQGFKRSIAILNHIEDGPCAWQGEATVKFGRGNVSQT